MSDYKSSKFLELFNTPERAERYDIVVAAQNYLSPHIITHEVVQKINELNLSIPKTLVLLAVGSGLEAEKIKQYFSDTTIIGVDFSQAMLNIAIDKKRINTAIRADITEEITAINPHSADAVICCGGTEFNPGKLKNIAEEMMRIAKKNALIAITVRPPNQDEARPGYAYYTDDEVKSAFKNTTFKEQTSHISFSMDKQNTQSEKIASHKKVEVIYNTFYFLKL